MSRKIQIKNAYKNLGGESTFYDGMITCSTLFGKLVCKAVWDMKKQDNDDYLLRALSGIPQNFSEKLLEVPVGTGVLAMPIYESLPHADITCLDYSADMMARAQKRATQKGLKHIQFVQGDVGKLTFPDGSFDTVLSLNGFHAFPDKEAAFAETLRVLKPGGVFCGCFYIKGENSRTDWIIRNFYEARGYFTPPYETADSLRRRLSKLYTKVELSTVKAMACFTCVK